MGKVMLVEDDADIRADLAALLCAEGFDVVSAAHGIEALELLRASPHPDVILLDLMMPLMNGWEFRAEQLKDPSIAGIPVLLLTAGDANQDITGLQAHGRIAKPIQLDELYRKLRAFEMA
jgi:CheY-like chemotaxis protein